MGSPCSLLPRLGTGRAYHVPHTRLDGLGSAYSAGGRMVCEGRGFSSPTGPLCLFGSSLSASLACSFLTTFISSSHGLAIPSDPSSRTALMLAVAISPRGLMTVPQDEATLSPELHTVGLLQPHVWVGYWWQHTRLCPPFGVITAVYATSCRTKPRNSNVPGFPPYDSARSRAQRPKRIIRVFSGAKLSPNFFRRILSLRSTCSASRLY
jgi:hypothetical protein